MKRSSKEAYWRDQLTSWASSAMSQKEFCKKRGYSRAALQYWQRRLKSSTGGAPQPAPFVQVQARSLPLPASTLKVSLPNGVSIDYAGTVTDTLIKSLAAIGG